MREWDSRFLTMFNILSSIANIRMVYASTYYEACIHDYYIITVEIKSWIAYIYGVLFCMIKRAFVDKHFKNNNNKMF